MPEGIFSRQARMQFWGTSDNPEWHGTAFHRQCCPCDCLTFADNFNRDDSTNLGDDWEECTGDWKILAGHLYVDTDDAIVACKSMASDQQVGHFWAKVTLYDSVVYSSWTDWKLPGTTASGISGTPAWSNTTNIKTKADASYATCDVEDEESEYLQAYNFDLQVPTDATISGVEVRLVRKAGTASKISDVNVKLITGGSSVHGANQAVAGTWGTADETINYGSGSNLWGCTLVADSPGVGELNVNATSFGVGVSAQSADDTTTGSIEYIEMRVRYTRTETWDNEGAVYRMHAFVGPSFSTPTYCGGTGMILELTYIGMDEEVSLYYPIGTLVLREGETIYGERQVIFTSNVSEFWLCVGEDEIHGDCIHAVGPAIWMCPESKSGYFFALGCGDDIPVYYDEMLYTDHYDHDTACPRCENPCCCPCIEQEYNTPDLTVTIVGDDCDGGLDGESTRLVGAALPGECQAWTVPAGEEIEFTCPTFGSLYKLKFELKCLGDTNSCEGYRLKVVWPPGSTNYSYCEPSDNNVTQGIVGDCSCDPLYLKFGPFRLWKQDSQMMEECYCCEEFYVEVTL